MKSELQFLEPAEASIRLRGCKPRGELERRRVTLIEYSPRLKLKLKPMRTTILLKVSYPEFAEGEDLLSVIPRYKRPSDART
mgnify:CR=1 FL=1